MITVRLRRDNTVSSKKTVLYVLLAILVGVVAYFAGVPHSETVVAAEDSNAAVLEAMTSLQASVDALHSKVDALELTLSGVAVDASAARECACNNPCGYVYTVTEYITVPMLVSPVYTKTVYVTETVQVTEVVRVPAPETPFDSDDGNNVVIQPVVTPAPSRTPSPTPSPSRTPSPTPTPTRVPEADEERGNGKLKCNQGVGNGPEGCSPGKSDSTVNPRHPHGPNDEGEGDAPGNPGRKREAQARK
jgi:hypothetical protein